MSSDNSSKHSRFTRGQWPDNICSGYIRYGACSSPFSGGFYLADASHGIPTIGAVDAADDSSQRVNVFNYPGETEDIARRLVACWNACVGIPTEELEMTVDLDKVSKNKSSAQG